MTGLHLLYLAAAGGLWWALRGARRWADRETARWRAEVAAHDTSMRALGRATTTPGGEVVDLTA